MSINRRMRAPSAAMVAQCSSAQVKSSAADHGPAGKARLRCSSHSGVPVEGGPALERVEQLPGAPTGLD
eukprot:10608052-Alexandrium_andersonii.AAC.1